MYEELRLRWSFAKGSKKGALLLNIRPEMTEFLSPQIVSIENDGDDREYHGHCNEQRQADVCPCYQPSRANKNESTDCDAAHDKGLPVWRGEPIRPEGHERNRLQHVTKHETRDKQIHESG